MFEKFGEFDSFEEINRAAEAQLQEGDFEAIRIMAQENGIDQDDIEDYLDGMVSTLCTATTAAIAKLEAEAKELELEGILRDWVADLENECMEYIPLSVAVRKKGKRLSDVMAKWVDFGFENRVKVSKKITDKCDKKITSILGTHELTIGEPDRHTRKMIYKEYYLGGETK